MGGAEHSGRPTQMAIAKKSRNPKAGSSAANGKRPFPWVSAFVLVVIGGALLWWFYGEAARGYAMAGTGYGAKNACSCRYISGRESGSCQADFVPGMELVFLSEDDEDKSVTAYVPLVASQTARFRDGYGCVLE